MQQVAENLLEEVYRSERKMQGSGTSPARLGREINGKPSLDRILHRMRDGVDGTRVEGLGHDEVLA